MNWEMLTGFESRGPSRFIKHKSSYDMRDSLFLFILEFFPGSKTDMLLKIRQLQRLGH